MIQYKLAWFMVRWNFETGKYEYWGSGSWHHDTSDAEHFDTADDAAKSDYQPSERASAALAMMVYFRDKRYDHNQKLGENRFD